MRFRATGAAARRGALAACQSRVELESTREEPFEHSERKITAARHPRQLAASVRRVLLTADAWLRRLLRTARYDTVVEAANTRNAIAATTTVPSTPDCSTRTGAAGPICHSGLPVTPAGQHHGVASGVEQHGRENRIGRPGEPAVNRRYDHVVGQHQQHCTGVVGRVQQAEQGALGKMASTMPWRCATMLCM